MRSLERLRQGGIWNPHGFWLDLLIRLPMKYISWKCSDLNQDFVDSGKGNFADQVSNSGWQYEGGSPLPRFSIFYTGVTTLMKHTKHAHPLDFSIGPRM